MGTILKELKRAFAVTPATASAPLPEPMERFAGEVVRRGMETPAILFLETTRPLSFLGSQVTFAASPLLKTLVTGEILEQIACSLEDRRTVGRLIDRIEELAQETGASR